MSQVVYYLDRMMLAGAPVGLWFGIVIVLVGLLGSFDLFPGHWLTAYVCAALLVSFQWLRRHWRGRDYVSFKERPLPEVEPHPLAPSDSIPIRASGFFSVEEKSARFSWLQGYFRSFATREHAVICLVQPKRLLLAEWPEKDVGMWYVFFFPKDVRNIRYGTVTFGGATQSCLAVEHEIHIPKKGRFSRERTVNETVILASQSEEETRRILADLLHDSYAEEQEPPPQPVQIPSQNGRARLPIGATRRLD